MLITRLAAIDGIHVQEYTAGGVYELPPHLSDPWLEQGVCEQDKMGAGPSEFKDLTSETKVEEKPKRGRPPGRR